MIALDCRKVFKAGFNSSEARSHGQWAKTPTPKVTPSSKFPPVVMFHGTIDKALDGIKHEGLKPAGGKGGDEFAKRIGMDFVWGMKDQGLSHKQIDIALQDRKQSVFLTRDPSIAAQYTQYAQAINPGSKGVILKVEIPADQVNPKKMAPDEASDYVSNAWRFRGTIPPAWIKWIDDYGREHALKMDETENVFYVVLIADNQEDDSLSKVLKFNEDEPRNNRGQWTSTMQGLAAKYPIVEKNYHRSSYTEMGSIGNHTKDVSRVWHQQISNKELADISQRWGSDVGKLMESTIALHDIGKTDAVEAGDRNRQHEFTLPIMKKVLSSEGFSEKEIGLATALTSHDLIGNLMHDAPSHQEGLTQHKVAEELTKKATAIGMPVSDFAKLQLAFFYADAGSYPYVVNNYMKREKDGRLSLSNSDQISAIAKLQSSAKTVLKWNQNQPRDPKGTSTGGQFARSSLPAGEGLMDRTTGVASLVGDTSPDHFYHARPGHLRVGERDSYWNGHAPQATGFANVMRVVGNPPVGKPAFSNNPQLVTVAPKSLLKENKVSSVESTDGGVNVSAILTFEDGTKAIYKPERGEQWPSPGGGFSNEDIDKYINNKKLSLAEREAMTYEVDQKLGLGVVPETVHRKVLEVGPDIPGSSGLMGGSMRSDNNSDDLRERYDQYREKAQEDAYDVVGDQMMSMFNQAKEEHAGEVANRVEEVQDIWNEEAKDYTKVKLVGEESFDPEKELYGSETQLRASPVLPLGTTDPKFIPRADKDSVDPLEILDKASVDVNYKLNDREKEAVKFALRGKLEAGYRKLGDVDTEVAKDHLTYDSWLENHNGTEQNLLDQQIQSFDAWKSNNGYGSEGKGEPEVKNTSASHPNGGSLQRFVENLSFRPEGKDGSYVDPSPEAGAKMAVLDYLVGSMDRHHANILYKGTEPVAIDNGYSFPASVTSDAFQFRSTPVAEWKKSVDPKLQSNLDKVNAEINEVGGSYRWSNTEKTYRRKDIPSELKARYDEVQTQIKDGPPVPEPLRLSLLDNLKKADWNKFVTVEHPDMSSKERNSFLGRVQNMSKALETPNGLSQLWKDQQLMDY